MKGQSTCSWDGIRHMLRDVFAEEPIEDLEHSDIESALKTAFQRLNFRQIFILIRRYKLDGGDIEFTLEQIGEMVGRSSENVRQHEATALRRLRHPSTKLHRYLRRS